MKRILILALTGALALGACARIEQTTQAVKTTISNIINPDNVETLEASYGAALSVAVGYRRLCERKVINKSCWNVIASVQPYEKRAFVALTELKIFVRKNPNVENTSLVKITRDAITAFENIQVEYRMK